MHIKRRTDSHKDLESVFIDFVFRRRFDASGGSEQVEKIFNAYIEVMKA